MKAEISINTLSESGQLLINVLISEGSTIKIHETDESFKLIYKSFSIGRKALMKAYKQLERHEPVRKYKVGFLTFCKNQLQYDGETIILKQATF
ncbi:MAG: hypothetical protein KG029_09785 [Bacteroidetes bacterium]|nr:hypothetical protein [Bacteroidota bacterium]